MHGVQCRKLDFIGPLRLMETLIISPTPMRNYELQWHPSVAVATLCLPKWSRGRNRQKNLYEYLQSVESLSKTLKDISRSKWI